jgi:hypothetical protein
MTLVVETGAGLANADAYVSVAGFDSYFAARYPLDAQFVIEDREKAVRRATMWVDARYRSRFPGERLQGRLQALEWPRSGACDNAGWAVAHDAVPSEIIAATCEAAQRELTEPGILAPDLERGGAVKRIQAGSVEIEYGANSIAATLFTTIDNVLGSLLVAQSPYSGRAVRG